MKSIHYLLLSAGLLICSLGRAQDTLRIDPHALDVLQSQTYYLGDSSLSNYPTVSIWLYNLSGTIFSDTITFAYSIANGGTSNVYTALPSTNSGVNFTPAGITIQPHDSILVPAIQFHISSPAFVIGSSTVVIWPVATTSGGMPFVLLDSASQHVSISYAAGIKEPAAEDVKIYTSGQVLYIQNNSKNLFGGIRIYSAEGDLVKEQQVSRSAAIPMAPYASGVYMVEWTAQDGTRAMYKVMNIAGQ